MSFSVPTSPATSRSTKAQPITPQRPPRQQCRSQSFYRSPLTPASPYTPLSLRSADSTDSSILTTPDNIGLHAKKRLVYSSVSVDLSRNPTSPKDKSLADVADNWRSRANENGIKGSFAKGDNSKYHLDESSDMSISDALNNLSSEEVLLGAPFMSAHRRLNSVPATTRPRAQSHSALRTIIPQPSSPVISRTILRAPPTASPIQRRTHSSYSQNMLSTPPPNRALTRQLKLKGSLTDPAQPRRREAFGNLPTPSQNINVRSANQSFNLEPNTSLDLFDINEDDYEYEADSSFVDNSISDRSFSGHLGGYPNFQHNESTMFPERSAFSDPFHPHPTYNGMTSNHVLPSIAESVEHHFHVNYRQQSQNNFYEDAPQGFYPNRSVQSQYNPGLPMPYPAFVPVPTAPLMGFNTSNPHAQPATFVSNLPSPRLAGPVPFQIPPMLPPTDCSVCLASNPATLAILQPCRHPLCSSCLTSALNIVGEKDMECAICKQSVADFRLVPGKPKSESEKTGAGSQLYDKSTSSPSSSFSLSQSQSSSYDSVSADGSLEDLQSAFDFGLDLDSLRASTPKLERQPQDDTHEQSLNISKRDLRKGEDNAVLRIDNVPWDITPLQISRWLQQAVERVHVLLDGKGKTMSHAYVEVKDASIAGAILRGETATPNAFGRKERGSVLGRGPRARGVTITRSGQQELLKDLFPHWHGGFDGSRPSLAGLQGDQVIRSLQNGLLTENELSGLMHLIREPDSHFLKVPVLPFHSLISLLSKFPADVDSRVFWSASIRDMLFDTTIVAIQTLIPRVAKAKENTAPSHQSEEYSMDLVADLIKTASECRVFTSQQFQKLEELAQTHSLPFAIDKPLGQFVAECQPTLPATTQPRPMFDPSTVNVDQPAQPSNKSLHDLAREFGVDEQVVQALAQRLAQLS